MENIFKKNYILYLISSIAFLILIYYVTSITKNKFTVSFLESEIIIPVNDSCDFQSYYIQYYFDETSKKEYLFRLKRSNDVIEVYNLTLKRLEKFIYLKNKVSGFFIEDINRLYLIGLENNCLSLIDSNSNVIWSMDVSHMLKDTIPRVIYSFTEQPLIKYQNKYIFNIVTNVMPPSYYKHETLGIFDSQDTKNGINMIAKFPDAMNDGKDRFGYYPFYSLFGAYLICSFSADHNIYLYNINDGEFVFKRECRSKFFDSFMPADSSKFADREYNSTYQTISQSYNNLIYDKYNDYILRVCLLKQNKQDSVGKINDFYSHEWTIIFMNSDFKRLEEVKFTSNIYNYQEMCVTKRGILISQNNLNNPNFNKNILSYKLIKINHE